jgi:hypothetical protein
MENLEVMAEGVAEFGGTPAPSPTVVPLYPSSHKYPKSFDEYSCVIRGSGTLVQVCLKERMHVQTRKGGGERNAVNCFSRGSRQRFTFMRAKICWDSIPKSRCFHLRVTFLPPQGSLSRPKECLVLFWKRLQAFLGLRGYSGVWKQEYTRNGDWHLHIILVVWNMPRSLARRDHIECDVELPADFVDVLAEWTARTWSKALGWKGEERCPENATYCKRVMNVRGAVNYLAKGPVHNAKWYETKVPESARPEGRWWGAAGVKMLPKDYRQFGITVPELQEVRKILADVVGNRSSGACHLPIWSATSPMTAVGGTSDGELFDEVKKCVENIRNASELVAPVQNIDDPLEVAA